MRGRAAVALVALLAGAGCAAVPLPLPGDAADRHGPRFAVGQDTFAFANDIRSRNRGKPDLYANYCFVLARAVRQFYAFARFDPERRRLTGDEYLARVRQVVARAPWQPSLPPDDRVVIPGYRNLFEFSRDQGAAVKAGLGGRFWTWVHWTNWRVVLPVTGTHQEGVAGEIVAELNQGRLVQLLVTNLPTIGVNHTLVAYAYRTTPAGGVEFTVYDPNDPAAPGTITFQRQARRFWTTQVHDTRAGTIRAFRMYYSRLL